MSQSDSRGVMLSMQPDTEAALLRRLQAGDEGAFDQIFEHFHPRLVRFLRHMAKNQDVALDLAEETWLRLVAGAAQLDRDTRLTPWLFTVARNLYISYCRSRLREQSYTADYALLWSGQVPRSPLDIAVFQQYEQRLEAALDELPLAYREVLLLVGVEGFKPMDAAAIIGIAPEALRQRLSRARAMLAQLMDIPSPAKGVRR